MKFQINDRVVLRNNLTYCGTVFGYDKKKENFVIIDWDDGEISKEKEDTLVLKSDVPKLEAEFSEERKRLQVELKKDENLINEKIKQASDILKEVKNITSKYGVSLSNEFYYNDELDLQFEFNYNLDDFKEIVSQVGWSTSSFSC